MNMYDATEQAYRNGYFDGYIEGKRGTYSDGCNNCRGAERSDEPFTVVTPNGITVEAPFNFCPTCGRKLYARPKEVKQDGNTDGSSRS